MASESHLDAEWKRIQKKTFTRWCNEHLRVQGIQIKELSTDFGDGVCLVTLLQVLSQKKVGKYNKKPRVRAQKLENVQLSLKFIESEKIRLVNIGKQFGKILKKLLHALLIIGTGDIVDGNLKLILGLIWTLILHYQISARFIDEDFSGPGGSKPTTARQSMLNYVQVSA